MIEMDVHAGHRERMRSRFLETELDGFDDINALELLLTYAITRKDTNPLAHALLDRFGSFKDVMEASVDDLMTVKGIGVNAAILIRLTGQLCKRYLMSKRKAGVRLDGPEQVFEYVMPLFSFEATERLFLICLDTENRVLDCSEISKGSVDSVYGNPRQIITIAAQRHASKIILAHNHPSGMLVPSEHDMAYTNELQQALLTFQIQLSDHVIVGDGECLSMRQHGCIAY